MEKLIICGGKKLTGKISASGSKNAALPLMGASILTDEKIILRKVPDLADIRVMIKILQHIGKKISFHGGVMEIERGKETKTEAPYELVRQMRASIIVLGPLLARFGQCRVSLPGGCAFGPRPVDLHIKGMENLGAKITLNHGYISASAKKLKGKEMVLAGEFGSSVLGTDNVMMAATLAEGKTVIKSAAREPECVDLAGLLVSMGAKISGAGTDTITIEGVDELTGADYTIIPDRIEVATYLAAGVVTGGEVTVENCRPDHLENPLDFLKKVGFDIIKDENSIKISGQGRYPLNIATGPYPGFPTDLQAIFTVIACLLPGESHISEGIYLDRFSHILELARLGAKIESKGSSITIKGKSKLTGAPIQASDLRCGAALALAALMACNTTELAGVYHIDRGYENFEEKLRSLGAEIEREGD
ncbi:UDP-N-acetylglucosamine 1-carboxyvinyltransferase [Candidatus Microgenomates bacterium]|nr:UDP-N-acetylglucosamine 1-carboxyvinyltransferase [Candidatus Microgenomates bacterium]